MVGAGSEPQSLLLPLLQQQLPPLIADVVDALAVASSGAEPLLLSLSLVDGAESGPLSLPLPLLLRHLPLLAADVVDALA